MTWNLYLDDIRVPTDTWENTFSGEWTVARSTQEAKALVSRLGMPAKMSLDHDLGGDDTSMLFLSWLARDFWNGNLPLPQWWVHSQNPVGARNIAAFMNSWEKAAGEDI